MEAICDAITQLTGAVNAQIEQNRTFERRLAILENRLENNVLCNELGASNLAQPRNEEDLKDISKLPDCVKELQIFDGNPVQYLSWVHNVENILRDYEIVRNKPIYRAILQHIRQKIRGNADAALISYNIFDEDWVSVKKCLSLHYADKRDVRTLEHQLNLLTQKNLSIDEYYANVNHQFSLIINKIKTEDYTQETVKVLVENYRNRALDVFIRGLNGDLSKMLIIQRPQTLPEAYTSCLEIQNLNFRSIAIHKNNYNNTVTAPINQIFQVNREQTYPISNSNNMPFQRKNLAYNINHQQAKPMPPRPTQLKPPMSMEVDRSIQSRHVDYINRPGETKKKQSNYPENLQKMYNIESRQEEPTYEEYMRQLEINYEEDFQIQEEENTPEVNFMTEASLAYHT